MMLRKGILNTVGNPTQRAAVMLVYIVAAHVTDPAAFGMLSSLVVLAITVGSLSSLSLGQTANRTLSRLRVARLRNQMAVLIGQTSLLISAASTGLFLIFSETLIRFVSGGNVASFGGVTIALSVIAISFWACLKGHIWASMRYGILLASSMASTGALFLRYSFFFTLNWPLPLLQAYAAMALTETAILSVAVGIPLARAHGLLRVPDWRHLRPVLRFTSIATLHGLVFTPVNILLISMITASLGSAVVGQFNILVQIRNAIVFLPNGFASVILTIMSRERRPMNLWRNSLLLAAMAGLVSLPIVLLAYIWRPAGMQAEYIPLLVVTALTGMVIALNTNIGQAFLALGWLWVGVAANVIWSVMTLCLVALALMFKFDGIFGVLVAIIMAYILHTAVQVALILRATTRPS